MNRPLFIIICKSLFCVSQRNNELAKSSVFAQRLAFGIVTSFERHQQKNCNIPSNIQLMEDQSNVVEAGSVALITTTFYDMRRKNQNKTKIFKSVVVEIVLHGPHTKGG